MSITLSKIIQQQQIKTQTELKKTMLNILLNTKCTRVTTNLSQEYIIFEIKFSLFFLSFFFNFVIKNANKKGNENIFSIFE